MFTAQNIIYILYIILKHPDFSPILPHYMFYICAFALSLHCLLDWGRSSPLGPLLCSASSGLRTSSSTSSRKRTGGTACSEAPTSTTGPTAWLLMYEMHWWSIVGENWSKDTQHIDLFKPLPKRFYQCPYIRPSHSAYLLLAGEISTFSDLNIHTNCIGRQDKRKYRRVG